VGGIMANTGTTTVGYMTTDWRYNVRRADYIIAAEDAMYEYDEYTGSFKAVPARPVQPELILSETEQEFYDQWA
jgi:hypothetical protein